MRSSSRTIAFIVALAFAGGLYADSLADVVVIANEGVRIDHISAASLKNVYTGRTNYWGGGDHIVIAVLPGLTGDALNEVTGMDASEFRTFWQRLVFSGRGQEPKTAADAASLVKLVASTRGAIALVPADSPLKGVKVLQVW